MRLLNPTGGIDVGQKDCPDLNALITAADRCRLKCMHIPPSVYPHTAGTMCRLSPTLSPTFTWARLHVIRWATCFWTVSSLSLHVLSLSLSHTHIAPVRGQAWLELLHRPCKGSVRAVPHRDPQRSRVRLPGGCGE